MLAPGRKNQRLIIAILDWELIYVDRQFVEQHTAGRCDLGRRSRRPHGGGGGAGGGNEQNYCNEASNRLMLLYGNLRLV